MKNLKVSAKNVRGGWVGVCHYDDRECPVLNEHEEPEIFQSQAEAVAVAWLTTSREIAAYA